MRNIGIVAAVYAGTVFGVAQTPTIDQSLSAKQPQAVEISPDGRYVAYTVQYTNWDENSFDEQVWIAATASGDKHPLTGGKKSSQSPQWSDDSRRIAFRSDRDGKAQIYVIAPDGGEAVALTNEDNGVGSFEWSPDGTSIAFTSTGPESKATKERKDKYGEFEVVTGDYTMNHLWLVKVPEEIPLDVKQKPKPEALTHGENFSVGGFAWSPDSKRIAFSATRDPDLSSGGTAQIYLVNISDKFVKKLTESKGPNNGPVLVAGRAGDRLLNSEWRRVFLLCEHAGCRNIVRRRRAAYSDGSVRRRPAHREMGNGRYLFHRRTEDGHAPVPPGSAKRNRFSGSARRSTSASARSR